MFKHNLISLNKINIPEQFFENAYMVLCRAVSIWQRLDYALWSNAMYLLA